MFTKLLPRLSIVLLAVLCLGLIPTNKAQAQQDAQYTQYMFNQLPINPAYAGTRESLSLLGLYRHQWVNIDGAPRTFSFSMHSPFGVTGNNGGGIYLESDNIGVHSRLSVFGSYAYRIPLNNYGTRLSLGVQGGILNYASDWADLPDGYDVGDPLLAQNSSKTLPNFGLGAFLYNRNYYLGVSVPHLLDNDLDELAVDSRQYRHYFFQGGYVFHLSESFHFRPSALVKMVPNVAPISTDLNAHFKLEFLNQDALWFGLGYRITDAIMFLTEYSFGNGLRLGYAYDYRLSPLNDYTSGTHEIMLGFDFDKGIDKFKSPRYF